MTKHTARHPQARTSGKRRGTTCVLTVNESSRRDTGADLRSIGYAVRRTLALATFAVFGAAGLAANAKPAPNPAPAPTPAPRPQPQTTPAPPTTPPPATVQLQTIVVTGTMIPRTEAETAQAITILKTSALKDMGIVNVEQALNTLTSSTPTLNIASSVGTFSGGGTYADLRALGSSRTLVLLDGQRLAGNAFNSAVAGSAVDLSGIPFSAIESVQVLREGASALYGSDAIAGVINFITKKNYQGAEIDANLDHPQEAGGSSGDVNFTFGHGNLVSDGYNVMITGSYSKQNELTATQRSFSAPGFFPALGEASTNNPGTWPATIIDVNGTYWQPGYPACAGNPYLTTYFGVCTYRYSSATDLIPKSDEASGMLSFSKSLPANNTLAVQYFYTQSKAVGWSGPEFYSFGMTPQADPTYFPTAAGLTCETYSGTCTGAPPDLNGPIQAVWTDPGNNRFGASVNTEQRALVTFSGENAGWNYQLDLNYSQNRNSDSWTGGVPDESVLAPGGIISNLVNPFGPQTAAGQAFIDSTYVNGVYQGGSMKRWSVTGHASHPLGDAFDSGTPATVAIGFDVHGDRYTNATTPLNDLTRAASGLTDFSIHGSRTVQAVFVELDVPMSKSLDVDISDREDRYSDFGTTNNGKVTVRYQPFHIVTFRGAASTGFRAPTLFNLYSPNFLAATAAPTMGSGNPFCTPGNYTTEWNPPVCGTQGLGLFGGNVHLTPETSQNFDFGVILAPIPNLGITLDYYRILLKNTIGAIPAASIYENPVGLASSIVTNSSGTLTPSIDEANDCNPYTAGTCGYVLQNSLNTGYITTDGFDVSVQYAEHTRFGVFHEDLEGTAVTQFRLQQYTGGPVVNMVSEYNGGAIYEPALKWQHELRVDWSSPQGKWAAGLSNRFYSSYLDEFGIGPTNSGPRRTVGDQSTWDAYTSYKPIEGLTVLFGIRNLFNTNPPYSNSLQNNFSAGYNSLFSDPILRDFYLNLKYRFL